MKRFALILLLFAPAAKAQVQTLTINLHWSDNVKMGAQVCLTQPNLGAPATVIACGLTNSSGQLVKSVSLLPNTTYTVTVHSIAYNVDVDSFTFTTVGMNVTQFKSGQISAVYTRPPNITRKTPTTVTLGLQF